MKKTLENTIAFVLSERGFWIYLSAILLLIVLPINNPGSPFYLNDIMIVKIRGDYFVHAVIFIPWAFFMATMRKPLWLWLLLGLLYATGTELLQYLLPYRRFNINDLISNSLGIIIGVMVVQVLFKKLKHHPCI